MIRGITVVDAETPIRSNYSLDAIFERKTSGVGTFVNLDTKKSYLIVWTLANGVYSLAISTSGNRLIATGSGTSIFSDVLAGAFPAVPVIGTGGLTIPISEAVEKYGRAFFAEGSLGRYAVLIHQVDSAHSDVRFFGTQDSIASRKAKNVANASTLAQAFLLADSFGYEETTEDITNLFADFLANLTSLGFTDIAWINPPAIYRQGNQRTITFALNLTNSSAAIITIPASTQLAVLSPGDYVSADRANVYDISSFLGGIASIDFIDNQGKLCIRDETNIPIGPSSFVMNFDYHL